MMARAEICGHKTKATTHLLADVVTFVYRVMLSRRVQTASALFSGSASIETDCPHDWHWALLRLVSTSSPPQLGQGCGSGRRQLVKSHSG